MSNSLFLNRQLSRLGLRRKKIFAIGFNKCGTTSLHSLFMSLGLSSYHGVDWKSCDDMPILHSYDCFSDGIPKDLAKLDKVFPGSKFILQLRDLRGWIFSRLGHIERMTAMDAHDGSPTWDNTEFAIKYWIKQRNEHHLFVLSYFADRPSDLLVVNFIRDESAAEKVCDFLGYETAAERPRENVNPSKQPPPEHEEMYKKCIAELNLTEEEVLNDIFCPSLASDEEKAGFPEDSRLLVDSAN
jgi:hypothetical protein